MGDVQTKLRMTMSVFNNARRVCSDDCAREARDAQNDSIHGYTTFQSLPVDCDGKHARFPKFAHDHINLRGRTGYGVAEGCVVDEFSKLRNNPAQLTRDRCRVQLFGRIFAGCPNLKPGVADPERELSVLQGVGSDTLEGVKYACKKTIMEQTTHNFMPMLACVKEVQKPENIVEPWVRGGQDTRAQALQQAVSGCQAPPRR